MKVSIKNTVKRILDNMITTTIVLTVTFFLVRILPGTSFENGKLTGQVKLNIINKYCLDENILDQYLLYITKLLKGDMGYCTSYHNVSVINLISECLPKSLSLGLASVVISINAGMILGISSYLLNLKELLDRILSIIISIPNYISSVILISVLSVYLGILPVSGSNNWKYYILPLISLTLIPMSYIAIIVGDTLAELFKRDSTIELKSFGASDVQIIKIYGIRCILPPIMSYFSNIITSMVTGSFIVETMFRIPGIGTEFISSVNNRDYNLTVGLVIVYCTILTNTNLIIDIIEKSFGGKEL